MRTGTSRAKVVAISAFVATLAATGVCTAQDAAGARREASGPSWTDFTWFGATLGTTHLAKGAILLPIRIDGLPGTHFVYLDLGAHGNTLGERPVV